MHYPKKIFLTNSFLNFHMISRKKSTYQYVFEHVFGVCYYDYIFADVFVFVVDCVGESTNYEDCFHLKKKIEIFFFEIFYTLNILRENFYFGANNFFSFYSTIPIVCDIFTRLISQNLIFSFNASSLFQTNF